MNSRQAKHRACQAVADVIQAGLVYPPPGMDREDRYRFKSALEEITLEMRRRSGPREEVRHHERQATFPWMESKQS